MNIINHANIDRTAAIRYFIHMRFSDIIIALIGIILINLPDFLEFKYSKYIGILLIISILYKIFRCLFIVPKYENQVDQIILQERKFFLVYSINRFNLILQQISIIKPFSIAGLGSPQYFTELKNNKINNLIMNLTNLFSKIRIIRPTLIKKISKNNILHYSIVEINTFLFGEKILFIHCINIDLKTGFILSDKLHELFYIDICHITLEHTLESRYKTKKSKFQYIYTDHIIIHTYGSTYKAAFDSRIARTSMDNQFRAMKNLIRDMKILY